MQLVLRSKLKEELNILDIIFALYVNSVQLFCILTIFPEGSSEMMSACKARALYEGAMMKHC